ncbi:MAG: hypothetical protein GF416_04425 [Candidatus Altiarchaeales archaeon]|nr:hypothetical protein [Candidatus Altiarchaeales archaeon]MBD3416366.1 hypothetical protein [Candidatus Altiarchaeales archaeon]
MGKKVVHSHGMPAPESMDERTAEMDKHSRFIRYDYKAYTEGRRRAHGCRNRGEDDAAEREMAEAEQRYDYARKNCLTVLRAYYGMPKSTQRSEVIAAVQRHPPEELAASVPAHHREYLSTATGVLGIYVDEKSGDKATALDLLERSTLLDPRNFVAVRYFTSMAAALKREDLQGSVSDPDRECVRIIDAASKAGNSWLITLPHKAGQGGTSNPLELDFDAVAGNHRDMMNANWVLNNMASLAYHRVPFANPPRGEIAPALESGLPYAQAAVSVLGIPQKLQEARKALSDRDFRDAVRSFHYAASMSYTTMGLLYDALHDEVNARRAYELAMDLNPRGRIAADKLAELEKKDPKAPVHTPKTTTTQTSKTGSFEPGQWAVHRSSQDVGTPIADSMDFSDLSGYPTLPDEARAFEADLRLLGSPRDAAMFLTAAEGERDLWWERLVQPNQHLPAFIRADLAAQHISDNPGRYTPEMSARAASLTQSYQPAYDMADPDDTRMIQEKLRVIGERTK